MRYIRRMCLHAQDLYAGVIVTRCVRVCVHIQHIFFYFAIHFINVNFVTNSMRRTEHL